jgi:hypothetical protein
VVKHRQRDRQVGAFGGFASVSLTNLDNMIFSMGSTFIFVSWIYEADDKDKIQGRLFEDQENHEDFALSARSIEELTEKLSRLAMSESTQASPMVEFNSDSGSESVLNSDLGSFHDKLGSFPMGLWNMASIHQEINSSFLQGSSMKSVPSRLSSTTWLSPTKHYFKKKPDQYEGYHSQEPKKASC